MRWNFPVAGALYTLLNIYQKVNPLKFVMKVNLIYSKVLPFRKTDVLTLIKWLWMIIQKGNE